MANTLMVIGDVYRGEMTGEAREYYLQSLALQEMMKNASSIAQLHVRLGWVSNQHDSRGQALWHFRKAIEASGSIGNKTWANTALTWIGWTYTKFGRYDQAREALGQARSYFEASGNKADLRVVLHVFADLYLNQENFEQARQYAEQSLALAEEFGSTELAAMERQILGNIEQLRGSYTTAIEHYKKTVAECEAVGASLSAIDALQRLAETYYRQENYQEALQTAERAVAIARPIDFPLSSHVGHTITGKARLTLNQPAQARLAFNEAIAIIERSRSQLGGGEDEAQYFFADKISPYHEMVALLVAQRQNADALAYAERAKGRTLLDVLRGGRADIVRAMTADEKVQEQRLRNDLILLNAELIRKQQHQHAEPARLADLQTRQQKARQAFENFQAGLYAAHPELKIQRGETPFLKSEEIAAMLRDSRSALLEFVVTDKQAFLFIITKSSPGNQTDIEVEVYPLAITAKDLGARAEAFRQHLAKRDPEFGAAARGLYDLLLKPAAAQLRGKTALVIVPDGPLWELPFQALRRVARGSLTPAPSQNRT
jgi:tetratricopeptide (TPR) repeat protein